jgi:hypothetical protein
MTLRHVLVLALVSASAGFAAQERDQQGQQDQQKQEQPQPQKPTLGAPTEPSLGPRNSTTTDPHKLMRIRTIFVERIDNMLSDRLIEDLSRTGRFRIVASRNSADAILRGTCFDSRRLKSVHSEVYLADRTGASIWQDIIRRPYNPPPLQKVVDNTAVEIVQHLGDSVREADRRP